MIAPAARLLLALLERPEAAATAAAPSARLDDLERAAALPPPLGGGLTWIEVPVRERDPVRDELLLAAGARVGLGPGLVVACGRHYVGRIVAVNAEAALVRGPAGADERTGVILSGTADGGSAEAIALGRGAGAAPVLNWTDLGREPAAGEAIRFRGRASDPPALAALGLEVGRAVAGGEAPRGDRMWTIRSDRLAAADGRVCVAAGAVPDEAIELPAALRAATAPLLPMDAVLGRRLSAWRSPEAFVPALLLRGGRAAGPAVATGGGWTWVRGDPPAAWGEAAVRVADGWFTRGDGAVPRGLWLGRVADDASVSGPAEFLRAAPSRRPQP